MSTKTFGSALFFAFAVLVSSAGAQEPGALPWTGYELALSAGDSVHAGRTARFRGTAYRVRGISELVPAELPVRLRIAHVQDGEIRGAWTEIRSASDGRFLAAIPVPEIAGAEGAEPRLEVEVGPSSGGAMRELEFPLEIEAGLDLLLRTDRLLYEPGEPVHVWGLVRDVSTRRPVAGRPVRVTLRGRPLSEPPREVETDEAGVVHFELALAEDAQEGNVSVEARIAGQVVSSASFRVGTRTIEGLVAQLSLEPEEVSPGETASLSVRVQSSDRTPVRGASVSVALYQGEAYSAVTGADGRVSVTVRAPAFLSHRTGSVTINVEVAHPAYGSLRTSTSLRLRVPRLFTVELQPRHGVVVPEVDDVAFLRVRDGLFEAPTTPVEVTLEGPAIRGGRTTVTTDANGMAEVPMRLRADDASGSGATPSTSVLTTIAGPLERIARIDLQVDREAEIVPVPVSPMLEVGSPIDVALLRRPHVARAEAIVEALSPNGSILAAVHATARESTVRLDLPEHHIGLVSIRARAVHADESLEGPGVYHHVIVRPRDPDQIRVEATRTRWNVGDTATVQLRTAPRQPTSPQAYALIVVRDLAAHGGERAFHYRFLDGTIHVTPALFQPTDEAAQRRLWNIFARLDGRGVVPVPSPPLLDALGLPHEASTGERMDPDHSMRDPWPLARELERRGLASMMRFAERRLSDATATGSLDSVSSSVRARRELVADLFPDRDFETLGGEGVTPAMLEAVDPSFNYNSVARRVARVRLLAILSGLATFLDPGDEAPPEARMASREPAERWLSRLIERGLLPQHGLDDPWGGRFVLRATRTPSVVVGAAATQLEVVSPGPDGRLGSADDVRDPLARAVTEGSPYAVASGEDRLMQRLAMLAPVERTLRLIADAYERINVEVSEEEIGDAVHGGVGEGTIGLGTIGTIGHGGGSGSGYGSGSGGLRGRSSRSPRIRAGHAGISGLGGLVRERFPPTLLFRLVVPIDPSGTTEIAIPLADAVTTYRVEAVVWRDDGWIWSDATNISAEREIVVDAPIPQVARRGDRIRVPLRVSNRGSEARDVQLRLLGDDTLGIPDTEVHDLTVAPGGTGVVHVEIDLPSVGEGALRVVATDPNGQALDAVQRPMRVMESARRVRVERSALVDGASDIELEVPARASAIDARIDLQTTPSAFAPISESAGWVAWAPPPGWRFPSHVERYSSFVRQAFWVGGRFRSGRATRETITRELVELAERLPSYESEEALSRLVRARAFVLLALSPLVHGSRAAPGQGLQMIARLRREVARDAVAVTDDPEVWAIAAASLAWSAADGRVGRERVEELVRRLRRDSIRVGDDVWLTTDANAVRSTVLWAMAELFLGRSASSFELLSTVQRYAESGHRLSEATRSLARATIERMTGGEPAERVVLTIDGTRRVVDLVEGVAELSAPELAEPGAHTIHAEVDGGAPLFIRVASRFGVPWNEPGRRGPFDIRIEGEVGGADRESGLELVVRNRIPRTIARPEIEVELPTGAELTAAARARLGVASDQNDGVLSLHLPALRPGNEIRVPLRLRWTVPGRLRGLGTTGHASDRPDAVSILAPRSIDIVGSER